MNKDRDDGGDAGVGAAHGFTVEELVQATVRAMILHDRERLHTSNNMEDDPAKISNKELAALLPEFSGKEDDAILWLERVDKVQSVYNVADRVMQLICVGKLTDTAKNWYLSDIKYVTIDWETLKGELKKMFTNRPDKVLLRKKFETRRWKRGEKFAEYFHEKIRLGNTVGICDTEMIDYIIDGFDVQVLQNQARMQNVESLEKLLTTMKNISDRNVSVSKGPKFAA